MDETRTHKELHSREYASKLNWLRASVLGANDGIISMAALLIGVAGATANAHTILLTGVAGLLAGACSMGAGEYVSVSSQRDTQRSLLAKEKYELEHFKEKEFEELVSLYEKKGLKTDTAQQVARELTEHDAFQAHVDAELGIDPENLTSPWQAAIASVISYSIGGLIPALVILSPSAEWRIPCTFIAVLVALLITGVISARASGAPVIATVVRLVTGGGIAMLVTFGVGRLLNVSSS